MAEGKRAFIRGYATAHALHRSLNGASELDSLEKLFLLAMDSKLMPPAQLVLE